MISERTSQLQELRRLLSLKEQELSELKWDNERKMGGETEHLRSVLKEKENFIKVSVHALDFVPCSVPCTPDPHSPPYSSGADAGPGRDNAIILCRD